MNRILLAAVCIFLLCGCAKEKAAEEKKSEAPVALAQPAVSPAVIPQTKEQPKPTVTTTPAEPAKDGEKIIDEGKWGFSVYDPKAGIIKYYTSNAKLLGERKKTDS